MVSILLEMFTSVPSPSNQDLHYCEAGTNRDVSFVTLEDEIVE